jgi:hypothetical protein
MKRPILSVLILIAGFSAAQAASQTIKVALPVDYDFTKTEEVDRFGKPSVAYEIKLSEHQSYPQDTKSIRCRKAGTDTTEYRCNANYAYDPLPMGISYIRTVPQDKLNESKFQALETEFARRGGPAAAVSAAAVSPASAAL